jgi:hypothetical protein
MYIKIQNIIYALTSIIDIQYSAKNRLLACDRHSHTSVHLIPARYIFNAAVTIWNSHTKKNYIVWDGMVCDRDTHPGLAGAPFNDLVVE